METLIALNQHGAINFMSAAVCMFWCLFNAAAGVDLALG
jgi:hypothetical protein